MDVITGAPMGRGKAVTKYEDAKIAFGIKVLGLTKVELAERLGRSRKTVFDRVRAMKASGEWDQYSLDLPRPDLDTDPANGDQ